MNDTTVYVGLDVHKNTITAAFVGPEPEAPGTDLGTLGSQQYAIDRLLKKLPARGKHRNVAVTAVARELAAFIWDAARLVSDHQR